MMAVEHEGERPGADYDAATYWLIRRAVADEFRERDAIKYGQGPYDRFPKNVPNWGHMSCNTANATKHSTKEDGL